MMHASDPRERPGIRALTALIVDDAEDSREMYALYLETAGVRVRQAATAYDALTDLQLDPPSLLVTDIALPGMDGVALCRAVRRNEALADTPVIALTGLAMREQDVEDLLDAGLNLVLFKPCLPDRLMRSMTKVLARASTPVPIPSPSPASLARCRRLLFALGEEDLVDRIAAAYGERPTLSLTVEDARRRWGLESLTCQIALRALTDTGLLVRAGDGAYVRARSAGLRLGRGR